VADPALVVSICSATFTGGGLVAQLLLYRFNGARLKVQLVFCYAEDGVRTWSQAGTRKPPTIAMVESMFDHASQFGIEYGRVRVTNVGRTAVSVENISFDVGRYRWYSRHRHTVQPMQFRHKDADTKERMLDLAVPIRLDPGDNVTADLHLWPTLASPGFGTGAGRVRVRGSAHAVGRTRATLSWRRFAWNLPRGAWTAFRDVDVSPELRVYRELWEFNHNKEGSGLPLLMHREITKRLAEGGTHEEIKSWLDKLGDSWINGLVAFNAHHAYHHETPLLWRDPADPRRSWLHRILWGQAQT
jgi:hypothetical protein